jgi:hypothetical protein
LKNDKGEKTKRDLVQFVEFSKYEGNITKLSEEVLAEVPRQIEDFYKLKKNFNILK